MAELSSFDSLEQGEIEILWRRLKGQVQVHICGEMNISSATYYRYQAQAFYKLGIGRDIKLNRTGKWVVFQREFGETISELSEEEIKNWKPKVQAEPIPEAILEEETDESPPRKFRLGFVVFLVAVAIFLILYFVFPRIYPRQDTPVSAPTDALPTFGGEQPTTALTEALVPLPTAISSTPTFTIIPPTSTITFTPTYTPTIATDTPNPTVTSSEIILFEDDFDSNFLDPNVWVPHVGKIYAFNGMMTTDDGEAEVVVGDGTWNNIEVSFDIVEMLCYGNDINPFVGLRVDDSFNYFALVYSNCRIGWNTVTNGRHQWIQGTYLSGDYNFKRMVVSVSGMTYQALDFPEYNTTDYNGGKVIIKLRKGMKIDNFKVVQLP